MLFLPLALTLFLYHPGIILLSTWVSCSLWFTSAKSLLVSFTPNILSWNLTLPSCLYLFPLRIPTALDQLPTCLEARLFSIPATDPGSHHHWLLLNRILGRWREWRCFWFHDHIGDWKCPGTHWNIRYKLCFHGHTVSLMHTVVKVHSIVTLLKV